MDYFRIAGQPPATVKFSLTGLKKLSMSEDLAP
jgi:hypothetical protein